MKWCAETPRTFQKTIQKLFCVRACRAHTVKSRQRGKDKRSLRHCVIIVVLVMKQGKAKRTETHCLYIITSLSLFFFF